MRIHLVAFIMGMASAYAWDTAGVLKTHAKIAEDVIAELNAAGEYPDLELHKNDIGTGADTETHDVPDGEILELWIPDDDHIRQWFTEETAQARGALLYYQNINDFVTAYQRIGNEIHLIQDAAVPAHQKYCYHGSWRFDWFELAACNWHGYSDISVPWSFDCTYYYNFSIWPATKTFQYWLNDNEDDDDENETVIDVNDNIIYDGLRGSDGPIETDPANLDVHNYAWGTYGAPSGLPFISEFLPGLNTGLDVFASYINVSIIQKQLKESFDATKLRLIERSEALPPLIPIADPYGSPPSISPSIFGPCRSPATIEFTVMENRKPNVKMTILCGSIVITEADAGPLTKIYDGKEHSVLTLGSGGSIMPWEGDAKIEWGGRLASGGTIGDGTHTLTIQVEDEDGNKSVIRSVSVKYDKTAPTGTITVDGI